MQEQSKNSWNQALDLVIESVLKPDIELRDSAREDSCYQDLMLIREQTVQYLKTLRQ